MSTRSTANWLLAIASTIVTLCALGVAGEAAARYHEAHRRTVPGTMPLLYYQHGRLNHALVRRSDYFGWVHINDAGFRGREVTVQKPSGVVRIMVVGSSTTFDPGVSADNRTWPARLQHWLHEATGAQVEVINCGVPGYGMLDDLIRLQIDLVRYQPDLIVLYEGHNDLFSSLRPGIGARMSTTNTPGEIPVVTPWGHWLTRHSLLYTKLAGRLQAIQFSRLRPPTAVSAAIAAMPRDSTTQGTTTAPAATPGADKFASDLDAFLAVAKSHGLSVVIPALVHVSGSVADERDPHRRWMWTNAVPFSSVSTVLRGYVTYDEVLRTSAEKYNALFIPTADFGLAGAEFYAPDDPIHFNDRGADEMARHLAARLLERGALGATKYRPITIASSSMGTQ